MTNLYKNYRKKTSIIVEEGKVYVDRKRVNKVEDNIYDLNGGHLLRLFSAREEHMDESTIVLLTHIDTENIFLPKDVIYTTNNIVAGYTYDKPPEEPINVRTTKMDKIVEELQQLKRDAIKLGKNSVYVNKINPKNTQGFNVTKCSNFRKVRNNENQIVKNIDEINDYYFRYISDCNNATLEAMIHDFSDNNYNYIGDYLEDTAPHTCTLEEYEYNLPKILRIDKKLS